MKAAGYEMNLRKMKFFIKQYWSLYLTGFFLVFVLKLFYSKAGTEHLTWILAPTAWWVRILSGVYFEPVPGMGYINHDLQFIIARSCSGVQFMIIAVAALIFSFVHRASSGEESFPPQKKPSLKKGVLWILLSLLLSYLFTIFVNGLRILLSMDLPPLLESLFSSGSAVFPGAAGICSGRMTPGKLHTLIGTVVYFSSLFVIFHLADILSLKLFCPAKKTLQTGSAGFRKILCRLLPPVFWYLFIVLGIPLLNRACQKDSGNFTGYASLILPVCISILILLVLLSALREHRRMRAYRRMWACKYMRKYRRKKQQKSVSSTEYQVIE